MVREHVSEAGAHDHHVVLVEVGRGGLALAAETQRVGIPGEELPSCYLTHREHQSINIIAHLQSSINQHKTTIEKPELRGLNLE